MCSIMSSGLDDSWKRLTALHFCSKLEYSEVHMHACMHTLRDKISWVRFSVHLSHRAHPVRYSFVVPCITIPGCIRSRKRKVKLEFSSTHSPHKKLNRKCLKLTISYIRKYIYICQNFCSLHMSIRDTVQATTFTLTCNHPPCLTVSGSLAQLPLMPTITLPSSTQMYFRGQKCQ